MADPIEAGVSRLWEDGLPISIDAVMAQWSSMIRQSSPWRSMPLDDRPGGMRRIVGELINAGWEHDERERSRLIVLGGREHGLFRRAQRCPRSALVQEFARMSDAIGWTLHSAGWPWPLIRQAVDNIGADTRLARRTAERAFDGSLRSLIPRGR